MAIQYNLDDVERVFGVKYTPEQRASLKDIPFSDDVLKACAGTHMLFPGYPLSLLDVRAKFTDLFFSKTGGWYENQAFAQAPLPVRWHLLRMEPVPESLGKNWDEQRKLLLSDEVVPTAALVAFATVLHFQSTKQRLFERCTVRMSDVDSDGDRVRVGDFDAGGFCVSGYWDGCRVGGLGVSASRKF